MLASEPMRVAAADQGIAEGAALDDRLGADVDVVLDHDAAELGEEDPAAVGVALVTRAP